MLVLLDNTHVLKEPGILFWLGVLFKLCHAEGYVCL